MLCVFKEESVSRKQFIEGLGATCVNWNWSWSFVNEATKQIIFGVWDDCVIGTHWLMFTYDWEKNEKGHKNKAFGQSREHIRLIEEKGYQLYIFKMFSDGNSSGVAKIKDFEWSVIRKELTRRGNNWYASDIDEYALPEEICDKNDSFIEGAKITVSINSYERNPEARQKCIDIHGCYCSVCGFDFENFYGLYGAKYIHIHHLKPLYEIQSEYEVCPENDLIPVCANCHAMIHRGRRTISIDKMKSHISNKRVSNEVSQ